MVSVISLSKFISDVEKGLISEIFSITIGNEKRVYGKSVEGNAVDKQFKVVYAVVS